MPEWFYGVAQEWSVISAAPISFAIALVVVISLLVLVVALALPISIALCLRWANGQREREEASK